MNLKVFASMSLATQLLVVSAAIAEEGKSVPLQEFTTERVEYAERNGVRLHGDLYAPKDSGAHQILIALYDGMRPTPVRESRAAADRGAAKWASNFARRGFVVLAIEHKVVRDPMALLPRAQHDVRAAVQFVRKHWGSEPIAIVADSATAHLAAMVEVAMLQSLNEPSIDRLVAASKKVKVCIDEVEYELFIVWPELEPA